MKHSSKKPLSYVSVLIVFLLLLGLSIWLVVWLLGWSNKSSSKSSESFSNLTHPLHPLLTSKSNVMNTYEKKGNILNPEFPSLNECEIQSTQTTYNHDVSGRNNQHCWMKNGKLGYFMKPNLCCPSDSSFGMNPQVISGSEVGNPNDRCCGGCTNCDRSSGFHENRRFHGMSEYCSRYASTDKGAYQVCINNVL